MAISGLMAIVNDKRDWVNDNNYQTILDGYFIYERAKALEEKLLEYDPTGKFSLMISGSVSPNGAYRGLALAGPGQSDVDVGIILDDNGTLTHKHVDSAVNKMRSEFVKERKGMKREGKEGIGVNVLYSASNLHHKSKTKSDSLDWIERSIKNFYSGENVELELDTVRSVPAVFVLDFYGNAAYVRDDIGMQESVNNLLSHVKGEKKLLETEKKLKNKKLLKLGSRHFSKLDEIEPVDLSYNNTENYQSTLDEYMDKEIDEISIDTYSSDMKASIRNYSSGRKLII